MPNQTSSGWKHDDRGRAYWQDDAGRHIHVRPKDFNHDSHDIPGVSSTEPSVVAGHYKPSNEGPKKANSWPSRSQPSYLSEKLAGRNKPYFGDGASQQSGRPDVDTPSRPRDVAGVTRPNASTDVYRDAKKGWGPEGPAGSAYDTQHAEYKQRGVEQARGGRIPWADTPSKRNNGTRKQPRRLPRLPKQLRRTLKVAENTPRIMLAIISLDTTQDTSNRLKRPKHTGKRCRNMWNNINGGNQ
ncbi:hypothetical protein PG984_005266 [Apiospora sp. TS-2023a]